MFAQEKPDSEARRDFFGLALLGLTGGGLAAIPLGPAQAAEKKSAAKLEGIFPKDAPAVAAGYSPGIVVDGERVIFVSGQGPADLKADMETQMRQTFDRIGAVLKAAGASFKNVAMIRAYFVNLKRDLPVYRKVRLDYLAKPYPASTAVGVTELDVPGMDIEIEAVAIV